MTAPKLIRVVRLDGMPMDQTYYTPEGYLVDRPILTRTGIFEYRNPDGSVRRELRLPEDVFDPESLRSYKGKPIIITHDAGLIDKDNVSEESIGTILTDGYRSGDNVRAEIIIHDTDKMKESRLKELSVGYNLELEETPGVWKGMPYDAIQRNIRVNHLALVREARAGDKVRLNIDSQNANSILLGGRKTKMANRTKKSVHGDSVLTPEELDKAIAKYLASKGKGSAEADEDDTQQAKEVKAAPIEQPAAEEVPVPAKAMRDAPAKGTIPREAPVIAKDSSPKDTPVREAPAKEAPAKEAPAKEAAPKRAPMTIGALAKKQMVPEEEEDEDDEDENISIEDRISEVKDRDDRRKRQVVPSTADDAQEIIGKQSLDIKELMDIIDTLLAERDYTKKSKNDSADDEDDEDEFGDEEDFAEDDDDEDDEDYPEDDDDYAEDDDDEDYPDDDEDDDYAEDEDDEEESDDDDDFAPDDEDDDYAEDEDDEESDDDFEDYSEDEDDEPSDDDKNLIDDEDNEGDRTGCGASCGRTRVRADSVDRIVRQRVKVGMVGRTLNLDGLENMSLKKAKKKIIHAVNPGLRLDGRSSAYIDAAYDMACTEIDKRGRKDTKYQRKQMFNADGRKSTIELEGAEAARQRMIGKMCKNKD